MSDPYVIQVDLDRSKAAAAATAAVADLKRIEAEAKAAATAEEQGVYQILAAEKGAAAQRRTILQQTNQQRISAAAEAAKAELGYQQQVKATGDEHEVTGAKGKQALTGIGADTAVATAAMGKLFEMVRSVGQAMDDAQQKSRQLSSQFLTDQDRYREMAFLIGKTLTPEFALEQVQFEATTGTTAAEALEFRRQFQYRGSQFVGKTLTPAQAEQLQQRAALMSVASGQDVGAAGGIAGLLAGQRDIRGAGVKGVEGVIGQYLRGVKILSGGAGSPEQLLPQWQALMSSGLAGGSDEAATMISLMAERGKPDLAEVYARRALEGLKETTGDVGKVMKGAGITQAMQPMEAVAMLRPVIAKQQAALGPGTNTLTALQSLGLEERQAIGIAMMMDRGQEIFGARRALAATITPASVQQATREAEGSQALIARQTDARGRLQELKLGAENADVEILRRQAFTSLQANKEINTTMANWAEYAHNKITFGALGSLEQRKIDQRVFEIMNLRRAAPATGRVTLPWTVEDRNREFNRIGGEIRAEGGDPLRDIAASNRQIAAHVQRQVQAPIPPKPVAVPGRAVGRGG